MTEKMQMLYLVDGVQIKGTPLTYEEAPELAEQVKYLAEMLGVKPSDFLVLGDTSIPVEVGAVEPAAMIIPKSKITAFCIPPIEHLTAHELVKRAGISEEEMMERMGYNDLLSGLPRLK